jgi:CRISPR-associated protein Csx16
VDTQVNHLDVAQVKVSDVVIGTLPVNLVAEVGTRGGRYLHLALDLPPGVRGKELSVEDMEWLGARLEKYRVERVIDE